MLIHIFMYWKALNNGSLDTFIAFEWEDLYVSFQRVYPIKIFFSSILILVSDKCLALLLDLRHENIPRTFFWMSSKKMKIFLSGRHLDFFMTLHGWQISTLIIYSKSAVIGEIQIKTKRYHYIPIRMARTIPMACKDTEQLELSSIAGRNKNYTIVLEKQFERFL